MAAAGGGGEERCGKITLDIRTKSVEQTLVPLVHQITTLVNAKEKPVRSERALNALVRVGQAVNMAVDRFVRVGETIAAENPEIQQDMCIACHEARVAGCKIEKLTDVKMDEPGVVRSMAEKTAMVRAARQLLSAITRVLILADRVVVKQLIVTKDKVVSTLLKIESCMNFAEFVQVFSQFGNEMVQLAHSSGDRQNDLKSEQSRAQMGVARSILEKSTMLLLTTAKTYLRHPECQHARQNRDHVIFHMFSALDLIHRVAVEGLAGTGDGGLIGSTKFNGEPYLAIHKVQSSPQRHHHQIAAFKAIKDLEDQVETTRVTLMSQSIESRLHVAVDTVAETMQDFTDSAYTSHEDRELILMNCERLRHEIAVLFRIGFAMDQAPTSMKSMDSAILKIKEACRSLKKQLVVTAMDHAGDVFRLNEDEGLLSNMRMACHEGKTEIIEELIMRFESHSEQLREVCKLLRHVSGTEGLLIWSEHMENTIKVHSPQVVESCKTLALYPNSKMAVENFEVFSNSWVGHINDLSILVKDVNEVCQGRVDKQVYLSLPRPGRHGANTRGLKPINLNSEEQAKIAKTGLEMKLITSEVDAEAERWLEPENEIVRRAKNMSCMAFSIYLFTRGEGPLKNTQDLFVQADYFAEEGAKLYRTAREFSKQVPPGTHKSELIIALDRVPSFCQHLNFTVRSQTVGKAATFNKVDQVIQDTKDLMNAIAKLVTSCYVCATKYNIAYRGQLVGPWNSPPHSYGGGSEFFNRGAPIMRTTGGSMNRDGALTGRNVPDDGSNDEGMRHTPSAFSNFMPPGNSPTFSGNFGATRSDSSGSKSPTVVDAETFRRSLSLSNRPGSANYDRL